MFKLFNTDTVDKALTYVMENGIKFEGGDKPGKTIIFARSHKHAEFIEKRFNKNYPEYSGKFLRIIDNYETKAQDLLESFCLEEKDIDPQIAVSVDMMDTGVDAPRVVNLVFFKLVRSVSKFWQMIGRGTRLRPDLFGPGEDKKHFLIFDFCENFEFFDENVYTHFEDELFHQKITARDVVPVYTNLQSYRDRVESYVRKNKNRLTIRKLSTNEPITQAEVEELERLLFDKEKLGTREEFILEYGEMPLGKFIRSIVGLELSAANQLFADFIQETNLTADQITFIDTIISYLTTNGIIDKSMLFEPPFTDVNDQGITGVFDDADVAKIVSLIDKVNVNALGGIG